MNEQELRQGIKSIIKDLKKDVERNNGPEELVRILNDSGITALTQRHKASRDVMASEFPQWEDELRKMYQNIDKLVEDYQLSSGGDT
jgi:hypothetical protein